MQHPHCPACKRRMQRHGKTNAGAERYRCPECGKTTTARREDTKERHIRDHFILWLTGKASKNELADKYGIVRRTLSREFQPLFLETAKEPHIPADLRFRILIVDGTYVHGDALCVLVGVTEDDRIFWRFVERENYAAWRAFFVLFPAPKVIVADGQKGLFKAARELFPDSGFQRCHFHVVQEGIHDLTRKPTEEAGKDMLSLLHRLKDVKNLYERDRWIMLFKIWEKQYAKVLMEKTAGGSYRYPRVRSARHLVRNALPYLFTYLDHPFCPNTTNIVEGWVNAGLAEALRRHRGLHLSQKKMLVSVILSRLTREKSTRKYY
jgi:predicted RNA-binding Zn-ribbon protein involved in translation (DUF1610 family)